MQLITNTKSTKGILYVLLVDMEDRQLVKVGATQQKTVDKRVVGILTGIWKKYRYFPRCYVKRFRTVEDVYVAERELLDRLKSYRYVTKHKFSGSTEVFDVALDTVTEFYDIIVPK